MSFRDIAVIVLIALAIPVFLLIRLVPTAKVDTPDSVEVSRSFGRSQVWFWGGVISLAVVVWLLKTC